MDLATLKPSEDPIFLQLVHPVTKELVFMLGKDGKPDTEQPVGFMVIGTDSEEFVSRERQLINRGMRRAQAAQEGRKAADITGDELQKETLETVALCIKGFRNVTFKGETLEYSPANALMLLREFRWMFQWLNKELADRANFIKG